jgi:antitoxin CcdA
MRMNEQPKKRSTRKATNVTVDAELLAEARALGINLSRTLEERLLELVKAERIRRWQEENRASIESMNRFIEKYGIFGEEFRTW